MHARDNMASASDLQQRAVSDNVIGAATLALGMLADATRLRLMVALLAGEQDVTALTAAVGAARPAVSQHLSKLRLAGLVAARRDGRRVIYVIADEHVARLVTEAVYTAEHRVSASPDHHLPPQR
ncbi:cadmium transporter [Actinoplanes sp. SE50]|uniref:ArsR/SmtB family transcription factor n=1 Tax=unclassified Actinoplanes TaxID=2626549 RepID=UPI00023EC0F2|nr:MULTISPECIES: metalloregulator ArsR/SmtB family transcription factor [unclassified Actinoplanes]AEV85169.1 Cadmium efflux system accessory protein [Actinoplanes sp. SE50/110]ATO83562.1 cadmium transporter [Actinoplanes sp. SE50]SLM00969.1 ArsR-family transcriptional regulator [Actinoplanes sp. SE50/110]